MSASERLPPSELHLPTPRAPELAGRRRQLLLVAVASGTLLNPLNSSMIAVALVDLGRSFGLGFRTASWLISVFYVASAVGQPLMGRIGDLYGRRRVFLGGLAVVAMASSLAPLAPSFALLLALRALQALGTSALFPSGVGIMRRAIGSHEARALAVVAVFSSVSAGIGPTLGGYLVDLGGWRAIFLVNLPVVAVSFALALIALPADEPPPRRPRKLRTAIWTLDPPGGMLFAVALVALLWFVLSLETTVAWWALPLGLASVAAFVAVESRRPEPFVDVPQLRANRALLAVYLQYVLVNVVFYSVFLGLPSFLQEVKGLSAGSAGLVVLSVSGLGIVTTPLAARLTEKIGIRAVLLVGAGFMTAGSFLLLEIERTTAPAAISGLLAVVGVSTGFNNLGLQAAMFSAAPREQIGTASGLFQTSRYLGTILSASLLGLAFGQHIDVHRLHVLALALGGLAVFILLLTLRTGSYPEGRERRDRDPGDLAGI